MEDNFRIQSIKTQLCCDYCTQSPVFFHRETGAHLCGDHLVASVQHRVYQAIIESGMLHSGDRIGVALSGGKDSTALLVLLHTLQLDLGDIEIIALTIDEGIRGYRDKNLMEAKNITTKLGITHYTFAFDEIYGMTLDQMVSARKRDSCRICGVLRKKALQVLARKCGATKVATGHCLDDEAQSVLMNCLRGDVNRFLRPNPHSEEVGFIPRIKPLKWIPEKEVTLYCLMKGIYSDIPECPYASFALRSEVRRMLNTIEFHHPGTMKQIVHMQHELSNEYRKDYLRQPFMTCDRCGEPSSSNRCNACKVIESLMTDASTEL